MLTVGILGGMGPMATVDLFTKIIECTPAKCDQEHLKVIVYNNPQIPSRVDAIINNSESPKAELIRSAAFLEKSGANILAMPCNTAHYWHKEIQASINIKLINMIENTAIQLKKQINSNEKIMLFATAATIKTGIYQEKFDAHNMKLLIPTNEEQSIITAAIDQVKAGFLQNNPYLPKVTEIMNQYYQQGVTSFIAGCTEIPLIFQHISGPYHKIDPTRLLAEEVVRIAYK